MGAVELHSIKHHFRFAKNATSLMQEQAHNEEPHIHEVDAAHVANIVAQTAAKSCLQPFTASALAFRGEFIQFIRGVGELGKRVARVCHEVKPMVGNVMFECKGLQERLKSTASQISGVRNLITAAHDRLEQHRGR